MREQWLGPERMPTKLESNICKGMHYQAGAASEIQ